MKQAQQAIGIFDSGVGGLTIAKVLAATLPHEKIIYFGDTVHLPYGEKSADVIQHFSKNIAQFLVQKQCKMIVIACNSASSYAFEHLKNSLPEPVILVNVIDPVVDKLGCFDLKKVGVIGTKATISSAVYSRKIKAKYPNLKHTELATPLFAKMIEEGFIDNTISKEIIKSYLSQPELEAIDALILGCTHYPLISKEIDEFFESKVHLLDSPQLVVDHIKTELERHQLLAQTKAAQQPVFYVSLFTESFKQTAQMFFGQDIELIEHDLWKQNK
ncbi:MAG: glutamate racemase [Flavobacteriales bacterium]